MTAVSPANSELARKNLSIALQRIARIGQNVIADAIGVSAATVSRFCTEGDLERACKVLAEAGLKAVPVEKQCYDKEDVAVLLHLARARLRELETVEQLQWD